MPIRTKRERNHLKAGLHAVYIGGRTAKAWAIELKAGLENLLTTSSFWARIGNEFSESFRTL